MARPWTDSEDAALIEWMLKGHSAGLISEAMGKTRDAVIGRSYRLGMKFDSQHCKKLGRPALNHTDTEGGSK